MGRRRPRPGRVDPARVRSAPAVDRCFARVRPVERRAPHQQRHRAPSARVRRHTNRGVLRAARRRGHAPRHAARAPGDEARLRDAPRARGQHPGDVLRTHARADPRVLPRGSAPPERGAGRRADCVRQHGAVARRGRPRRRPRVHRRRNQARERGGEHGCCDLAGSSEGEATPFAPRSPYAVGKAAHTRAPAR